MAATESECRAFYQQLVRMLQELGMDEVVQEVEEEWVSLDALTDEEHLLLEGRDPLHSSSISSPKRSKRPSSTLPTTQLSLGLDEEKQHQLSGNDTATIPIEEQLYPPQRRVLLLINAIEQTLAQPTFQGLAVMDMTGQQELHFKSQQHPDQSFTLSRAALQQDQPRAQALLKSLHALTRYIDPTGEMHT